MQINLNEIHIWPGRLQLTPKQEEQASKLLSADERKKAQRYKFPIHRSRFVAARSMLRKLLSLYLNIPANKITFDYSSFGKPHLRTTNIDLQFNLAHSDDVVVYAITIKDALGIDVEKIQENYDQGVAKRFFSGSENDQLIALPEEKRTQAFYRIWARKEAVIKAIGKGLSLPLNSFSVSAENVIETVNCDGFRLFLTSIVSTEGYESALASYNLNSKVVYCKMSAQLLDI